MAACKETTLCEYLSEYWNSDYDGFVHLRPISTLLVTRDDGSNVTGKLCYVPMFCLKLSRIV